MDNRPDKIIVHHTAYGGNQKQYTLVNQWHKERDFEKSKNGVYCGYHVLIEKDGSSVQARDYEEKGQHVKGENQTSIGIGLSGNFDEEMPTEAQKETLAVVLKHCMDRFKIPASKIYPHRKFSNTHCYGTNLDDNWAKRILLEHEINYIKKIILWIQINFQK